MVDRGSGKLCSERGIKNIFPGGNNFNGQYLIQIPAIDLTSTQNEQKSGKEIILFPNPGSASCSVQYHADSPDARLLLINAEGKILLNTNWQNNRIKELDLTNFPAGIYLMKIENSNAILIKENKNSNTNPFIGCFRFIKLD